MIIYQYVGILGGRDDRGSVCYITRIHIYTEESEMVAFLVWTFILYIYCSIKQHYPHLFVICLKTSLHTTILYMGTPSEIGFSYSLKLSCSVGFLPTDAFD